jgi:hypothetical protein
MRDLVVFILRVFLSNAHTPTQHNTTQHNTTQNNTTQHNTTQHNIFRFTVLSSGYSTKMKVETHVSYVLQPSGNGVDLRLKGLLFVSDCNKIRVFLQIVVEFHSVDVMKIRSAILQLIWTDGQISRS